MMAARRPNREVGVPELLRTGPYRFLFHSREHEPPHVHVVSIAGIAGFGLGPVELWKARGYSDRQLARIREIVVEHESEFLDRWHDYFTQ